MDVKTCFCSSLDFWRSIGPDVNFHLLIENVTLVCLDYYMDYYFSNFDYFR